MIIVLPFVCLLHASVVLAFVLGIIIIVCILVILIILVHLVNKFISQLAPLSFQKHRVQLPRKFFEILLEMMGVIILLFAAYFMVLSQPSIFYTVSGFGSGAAMAIDHSVAFSSNISGIGSVFGLPYDCNGIDPDCNLPQEIRVTEQYSIDGFIDNYTNISHQRVYIYCSNNQLNAPCSWSQNIEKYYDNFNATTYYKNDIQPGYAMITNDYGNKCESSKAPNINNCHYSLAGDILSFILNTTLNPEKENNPYNNVISIDQKEFVPSGHTVSGISMANIAYVYVSSNCTQYAPILNKSCKLHVVYHSCNQDLESKINFDTPFNDTFVRHAGYNQWAETNNLIILYPQATISQVANPMGCWDTWGYSSNQYNTRNSPQLQTIDNMAQYIYYGITRQPW